MLNVRIVGTSETKKFFERVGREKIQKVGRVVELSANDVKNRAKSDYLRGPRPKKLGVVSSTLIKSVKSWKEESLDGAEIVGKVGTNVKYGIAWETGDFSVLVKGGRTVKTDASRSYKKKKREPRPFLQPALEDEQDRILKRIEGAVYG